MDIIDRFEKCECDLCHKVTTCRLFHCDGIPVLGTCQSCDPVNFERLARQLIDAYLTGEVTAYAVIGAPVHTL